MSEEDFNDQITFSHKDQQWIVHPEVVKYICQSDERYHVPHISCPARIQEAKKEHGRNPEMGISGLNISDKLANGYYEHFKRMHMPGKIFRNITRWRRLEKKVAETLKRIRAAPDMGRYWNSRIRNKKEFLAIFHRALTEGRSYLTKNRYRQQYPNFRIRWVRGNPKDIAVYDPVDYTLYLHVWLLSHFRRCDALIIGLHEILGHHLQEIIAAARKTETTTQQAESCGMMCEEIISKHKWSTPTGNTLFDLSKCMYQWQLHRLVRAQVDLRLHSRDVMRLGKTVDFLWNQDPSLRKHITPLPSETIRCASNPAQAQAYVLYKKHRSIKYCHA